MARRTTADAPLAQVRELRRAKEERDRAERQQQQQLQLKTDLTKQGRELLSRSDLAKMQGQQAAREAERGRQFTAEQSSKQAAREADRSAFDAFTKGVLTPEQASVAGSYRPETGYRFGDIGTPTPLPAAGRGGRGSAGLPKAPDMLKMRNDLFGQYYDKGRGGKVLRDQYKSFDDYMADVAGKYASPQQAVGQQPSALPPAGRPSSGTITGRGGVLAASRGGQPVDPEQYAQSLLPNAPTGQQKQVEQPIKKFNVAPLPVQEYTEPIPDFSFENQALKSAFAPPQTLEEFESSLAKGREQKITEAFRRPPTLAEYKRGQLPIERNRPYVQRATVLPNQRLTESLRQQAMRERAMREGGERYY